MKEKPIVGIIATSNYMKTSDTFQDTYHYGNNYVKKLMAEGAIPYFIPLLDDGVILDSLRICDGLLIPGGSEIKQFHFDIIEYFYKKKKPILGICLGMQALAAYFQKDKKILKRIDNGADHHPVVLTRDNETTLAHEIKIEKESLLYSIIKKDRVMVNSVHKSTIISAGDDLKVVARSNDGLIEGIEYKDDACFILGLQFHPEILSQFDVIFAYFINECEKRKNNLC